MNRTALDPHPDHASGSLESALAVRMKEDSDFADWMATEYRPIAGGWQY